MNTSLISGTMMALVKFKNCEFERSSFLLLPSWISFPNFFRVLFMTLLRVQVVAVNKYSVKHFGGKWLENISVQ